MEVCKTEVTERQCGQNFRSHTGNEIDTVGGVVYSPGSRSTRPGWAATAASATATPAGTYASDRDRTRSPASCALRCRRYRRSSRRRCTTSERSAVHVELLRQRKLTSSHCQSHQTHQLAQQFFNDMQRELKALKFNGKLKYMRLPLRDVTV